MKKILILGHVGMLGHMVSNYFSYVKNWNISTISSRWPSQSFKESVTQFWEKDNGDYIINCIGAIHQKTSSFDVNIDLPIWLDKNINGQISSCKVIHPGTDCEMDNDNYGNSKRKASDFILNYGSVTKIIQTSIIGPEIKSRASLFEWFINNKNNKIDGYNKFYWNGNTTLQWSKICADIIINWDNYNRLSIPASKCISKYELLKIMQGVFLKKIIIVKKNKPKINKCLKGNITVSPINIQLIELKKYMSNSFYSLC